MKNFIDALNEYTNNEYKFMLKSALLQSNADFCVIEIFYKDGLMMSKETKDKINEFAVGFLPKAYKE